MGGDTAEAADLSRTKGYSIPYNVMLSIRKKKKKKVEEEGGREEGVFQVHVQSKFPLLQPMTIASCFAVHLSEDSDSVFSVTTNYVAENRFPS